jgi:Leucine-rich repeat (LRR) protein
MALCKTSIMYLLPQLYVQLHITFLQVSSRIVKLVMRNNALTTVHGIESLKSLVGLDLSYNIISNFSELEVLGTLPLLQNLWLEDNPICCARWYRPHVFSFFCNPENVSNQLQISNFFASSITFPITIVCYAVLE